MHSKGKIICLNIVIVFHQIASTFSNYFFGPKSVGVTHFIFWKVVMKGTVISFSLPKQLNLIGGKALDI